MLKILPKLNKTKIYKTKINPNSQEFYKMHSLPMARYFSQPFHAAIFI